RLLFERGRPFGDEFDESVLLRIDRPLLRRGGGESEQRDEEERRSGDHQSRSAARAAPLPALPAVARRRARRNSSFARSRSSSFWNSRSTSSCASSRSGATVGGAAMRPSVGERSGAPASRFVGGGGGGSLRGFGSPAARSGG